MRTSSGLIGFGVVAAIALLPTDGPTGFGVGVAPLDEARMASSRGGVVATVIEPQASEVHRIDNPRLRGTVYNHQGQSETTLILHHGTTKTGRRTVATPAPNYSGALDSRFTLRGRQDDLVLKYYNTSSGRVRIARTVPDQRLHRHVKLYRVRVWNLTDANLDGSIVTDMIDGRGASRPLASTDSLDHLLAQCDVGSRIQFQLVGNDDGGALPRLDIPACANFRDKMTVTANHHLPDYHSAGEDCMNEIQAAITASDPGADYIHVVVTPLYDLQGFHDPDYRFSVVDENQLGPGWERPAIILHEIGHDAGAQHPPSGTDPLCVSGYPSERDVMCPTGSKGRRMGPVTCAAFYTGLNDYHDFNEVNGGP